MWQAVAGGLGVALVAALAWWWRGRSSQWGKLSREEWRSFRVLEVRRLTHDTKLLVFEGDIPHLPGTHLRVDNGAGATRSYSPTQISGDSFQLAIKRYEGGKVSSFLHSVGAGDAVRMKGPTGSFRVEALATRAHALFLAAGSGITPIYSVLRHLVLAREGPRLTLVYCSRSREDIMLEEEIASLQELAAGRLVVHHVLSREHGRLQLPKLRSISESNAPDFVGLCGPLAFTTAAKKFLSEIGHVKVRPPRSAEFWLF